jgi:hypothetical protein
MKIEVEVDLKRVEESIVESILQQLDESINESVRQRVALSVDGRLREMCNERLEKGIEEFISQGWPRTNNYGEPTGPKITFVERIRDMFFKDSYRSERDISERFSKLANESFAAQFHDDIKWAKVEFRKAINSAISGKVMQLLREAVKE